MPSLGQAGQSGRHRATSGRLLPSIGTGPRSSRPSHFGRKRHVQDTADVTVGRFAFSKRVTIPQLRRIDAVVWPLTRHQSAPRLAKAVSGVLRGATRLSFRRPDSSYNSSSRRHLSTTVVVLAVAIVGSLSAILLRTSAAAHTDSAIVDLRKSLP